MYLIIFRYDETDKPIEVCLLDFQINKSASLSLDLNYLFYASLDGDVRKNELNFFLDKYYESFERVMKASETSMTFNKEQLFNDCIKHNRFGLILSMLILTMAGMESTEAPDLTDVSDEKNQSKILDMIDSNPIFRSRYLDMFDEMIAHGVINS